ncbi:MAG: hypothetical protein Q7R64_04400 [bacterium]|nr:hypothetical protein [bacterium]
MKHSIIYYSSILFLLLLLGLYIWVPLLFCLDKTAGLESQFRYAPFGTSLLGSIALILTGLFVAWLASLILRRWR